LILLFLISVASPIVISVDVEKTIPVIQLTEENEELDLLRAEHYLYLEAEENVDSFNVRYSFPPEYNRQYPIFLELINNSSDKIIDYKIEDDIYEPNKFVNFTIDSMEKNETVLIHFNYWVLVNNYDYSDLPKSIKIPEKSELPENVTKWLSSTEVVQKDKLRIKLRARQMKFITNNLLKLAERISRFSKQHRRILFLLQYRFGSYGPQDALTTLKRNGECPGISHLGSALFRANGVPARSIMATPSNYDFWFEMHYMLEYYSNEKFGWILSGSHSGVSPIEHKKQIIHRICYPEDENNTQADFIYPKMTGIERWFWVDNENVTPYYKDLKEGSKSRGFFESEVYVNSFDANWSIEITKEVFSKFEYYIGLSLSDEDYGYFTNATDLQMTALNLFKDGSIYGYLWRMHLANVEYDKIQV